MLGKKIKRILGIDPGFALTGWGVIDAGSKLAVVDCGCIKTQKTSSFPERLIYLADALEKIIAKYKPEAAAIEKLFFCNNVKTGIQVGEARGVAILAAARHHLPIVEFTPLEVKQAVSGYGRASKTQVERMVKTILNLRVTPRPDDVTDALAIAICGLMTKRFT
jgi:crossover junction endodeoxyribonuclease RuvC